MSRKIVILVVLLMLTLATQVSLAQEDENIVRAIWNPQILVLINISGDGVDVSELSLEGENGFIYPWDWVMEVNEDTTLSYTLTDMRPGSCLLVYPSGTEPEVPSTVDCTRIIGRFTPSNLSDVIWEISDQSFTPVLAGNPGTPCDTTNRTACDIVANPRNTNTATDGGMPERVRVRALWTLDSFVVINISPYGADLSDLTFTSSEGEIAGSDWVMEVDEESTLSYDLDNVRPGSCLVAYLNDADAQVEAPDLPPNVRCTRIIGFFTAENPTDIVWNVDFGGFTPSLDGEDLEACSVEGTTDCTFEAPNADLEGADLDDTDETTDTGAPVRAIWTTDIFVVINISGDGVDLSNLTLESADGLIEPFNWVMETDDDGLSYSLEDVRPGSCLIAYLNDADAQLEAPELPENVECTRIIGKFTAANPADIVWSLDAGGFTPVVDGEAGETCEVGTASSCDIALP